MLIRDFSERATECIRYAQRARSNRDREFFVEMARAWCGVSTKKPKARRPESRRRRERIPRRH